MIRRIFKRRIQKSRNGIDEYKVIDDLQIVAEKTLRAYQDLENQLQHIQKVHDDKVKDLQLFKGLSSISMELLSSKDFRKSIRRCLKTLTNSTKYNHCAMYEYGKDDKKLNIILEYLKGKAIRDFVLPQINLADRPHWLYKLKKQEVICENDSSIFNDIDDVHGVKQLYVVPIIITDQLWGSLLLTSYDTTCSTSNEIEAISTVANMFGESIRKHNLLKETNLIQDKFHDFSSYLLNDPDNVAFWLKDYKDRYLFLNDTTIQLLFPGKTKNDCFGKTDSEIIDGSQLYELCLDDVTKPEHLAKLELPPDIEPSRICNISDQITRHFGHPCKFFELVGEKAFEVWKSPLFRNTLDNDCFCCAGTVGALKDVTMRKEEKLEYVKSLQDQHMSFPINGTDNFYLIMSKQSSTIFLD